MARMEDENKTGIDGRNIRKMDEDGKIKWLPAVEEDLSKMEKVPKEEQ